MRASTLWLMLLGGVSALACASGDAWWESAVVYQIYPRSFKDSDGDGIGDLNGIASKLEYLKELGVDAIWMSPIFKSPMYDFGYDIADYKAIATEYGNMTDFDNLMTKAKSLGIRVVLDYVPNHTSHESEWFVQSSKRNGTYAEFYIWADGLNNNTSPPNNWVSIFRKSAWEYNADRGQYYLHQFVIQQPDLNYRSGYVQQQMKEVLRFWLDKGVSGFRVDAVNMLYEVANGTDGYPDEPLSGAAGYGPDDYEYLNHIYTKDRNETYDVVYDWRAVLDEYTTKHNESKIMMTEAYTELELMMRYYGNGERNGSIPFNFAYLGLASTSTAVDFNNTINEWMNAMPEGKTANWVNGNHDNSRMASRQGVTRVDTMNMMAMLLPGVTITYQGEELGMTDGEVTWEQTQDPQACNTDDVINYYKKSRDPARTPFHWDATSFAGFTTGNSTWLPVASNYATVNVAVEKATNKSHLNFYKQMVALKNTAPVRTGTLDTKAPSDTIFVITRTSSEGSVVGLINLDSSGVTVDLTSVTAVPDKLTVAASGIYCTLVNGVEVAKTNISMPAYCAIAFKSEAKKSGAHTIAASSGLLFSILFLLYSCLH
ncbi:maltase A1-like [Anticarsia gemmatalis]|uniref:maltase A1-like n=1 Tax=Anticarsia gemmatalis TaxID=129554 RepID=UPI003F770CC5